MSGSPRYRTLKYSATEGLSTRTALIRTAGHIRLMTRKNRKAMMTTGRKFRKKISGYLK